MPESANNARIDEEYDAGYYRHVIPGDGQHMGEARNVHGLVHLR